MWFYSSHLVSKKKRFNYRRLPAQTDCSIMLHRFPFPHITIYNCCKINAYKVWKRQTNAIIKQIKQACNFPSKKANVNSCFSNLFFCVCLFLFFDKTEMRKSDGVPKPWEAASPWHVLHTEAGRKRDWDGSSLFSPPKWVPARSAAMWRLPLNKRKLNLWNLLRNRVKQWLYYRDRWKLLRSVTSYDLEDLSVCCV